MADLQARLAVDDPQVQFLALSLTQHLLRDPACAAALRPHHAQLSRAVKAAALSTSKRGTAAWQKKRAELANDVVYELKGYAGGATAAPVPRACGLPPRSTSIPNGATQMQGQAHGMHEQTGSLGATSAPLGGLTSGSIARHSSAASISNQSLRGQGGSGHNTAAAAHALSDQIAPHYAPVARNCADACSAVPPMHATHAGHNEHAHQEVPRDPSMAGAASGSMAMQEEPPQPQQQPRLSRSEFLRQALNPNKTGTQTINLENARVDASFGKLSVASSHRGTDAAQRSSSLRASAPIAPLQHFDGAEGAPSVARCVSNVLPNGGDGAGCSGAVQHAAAPAHGHAHAHHAPQQPGAPPAQYAQHAQFAGCAWEPHGHAGHPHASAAANQQQPQAAHANRYNPRAPSVAHGQAGPSAAAAAPGQQGGPQSFHMQQPQSAGQQSGSLQAYPSQDSAGFVPPGHGAAAGGQSLHLTNGTSTTRGSEGLYATAQLHDGQQTRQHASQHGTQYAPAQPPPPQQPPQALHAASNGAAQRGKLTHDSNQTNESWHSIASLVSISHCISGHALIDFGCSEISVRECLFGALMCMSSGEPWHHCSVRECNTGSFVPSQGSANNHSEVV